MPYAVLSAGIDGTGSMTTLREIQSEIVSLGASDYKALRRWFAERDSEAWDRELEEDAKSGGLDFLGEEARIAAREAGSSAPSHSASIASRRRTRRPLRRN